MSACYLDIYVENNKDNLSSLKGLLNIIEAKDWDKLIQKHSDDVMLLVDMGSKVPNDRQGLYSDFDNYLDMISKDLSVTKEFLRLNFTASPSFQETGFINFLGQMGFDRVEASIEHTGYGMLVFFLDGKAFEDYDEEEWNWLPRPSEDDYIL